MKRIIIPAALTMALLAMPTCSSGQWPLGREGLQGLKTEPSPTVTIRGRFQVFTSPNVKGETFMLDTDTGRMWILKKDSTTGLFTLERIQVEEVDASFKGGSKASISDAGKPSTDEGK